MIAYISGHLDLTEQEFLDHYLPLIQKTLEERGTFVVGDARGADVMAQRYIVEFFKTYVSLVPNCDYPMIVYHMFDSPRNNMGNFRTKGGYTSDEDRDGAMTHVSDYDIAWVRPGREKSGTAKNLERRKGKLKSE